MPPDQKFRVREKFRRILQSVGATETLFTTRQIFSHLGNYIEKNKLHDPKDMHVVRCKGDVLEELFGLQEFNIELKGLWQLILPHIIPATNREVLEEESKAQAKDCATEDNDDSGPRRTDLQWMLQFPWWYFVDTKSRKTENVDAATVSGSVVAASTVYAVDTEYDSSSNPSNKPRSADVFEEDRFLIEFEPDSGSEDDSDDTEPIDSDDDDVSAGLPVEIYSISKLSDDPLAATSPVSRHYLLEASELVNSHE